MSAAMPSSLPDAEIVRLYEAALERAPVLYAYAIQAGEGGPVKIGVSKDPARRLRELQKANAEKLRGLAAWRVLGLEEAQLHEEYAELRIHGEWFEPAWWLIDDMHRLGGDFEGWA